MPHVTTTEDPQTIPSNVKLFVNDGPLLNPGRLRPSSTSLPIEELRTRYTTDGYLFLKNLIPRPDVLKAREQYFTYLSPTGVLSPSTSPVEGIYDITKPISQYPGIGAGATGANGHPGEHAAEFVDLALKAHAEPWYTDFCQHPALLDFVKRFTGWEEDTVAFRRTLLRNNIPGTKAIGVHYDQIFLRYGEDTSVTAWVPMGDISLLGGGLIYLEDGVALGKSFEEDFSMKAKASGLTDEEAKSAFNQNMMNTGLLDDGPARFGRTHDRRWLVSEYEAGDVVLHSPYTIHASTVNHDPDHVIRLATDLRFVDSSKPWDTRWSKLYTLNDGV
ncbi:phytanoyl-CoA hydroxylase [Mollisia scopiformis]|uniref:Phytanoyl-CoA hydroxylase n=1 Tax=Mollisia scopiformis TaxID=149040 RepID=A0A132B2Q4_MOLSC|nr:phytanoyl-CoA hydroxylase [Mollisia scopiformis]KUJ06672.1 phytanoyl-CoA hydroxylase [Mollisia scopiformis]